MHKALRECPDLATQMKQVNPIHGIWQFINLDHINHGHWNNVFDHMLILWNVWCLNTFADCMAKNHLDTIVTQCQSQQLGNSFARMCRERVQVFEMDTKVTENSINSPSSIFPISCIGSAKCQKLAELIDLQLDGTKCHWSMPRDKPHGNCLSACNDTNNNHTKGWKMKLRNC